MKPKKAKKSKKRAAAGEHFDRAEVEDELTALQAIFGDDLTMEESRDAFTLLVVPHPGDAEANYVSIKLEMK